MKAAGIYYNKTNYTSSCLKQYSKRMQKFSPQYISRKLMKKKNIVFIILAAAIIVLVSSREMRPFTSTGFMKLFRTPFKLGFQKQVFEMYVGETLDLKVNRINVRVKYTSSNFKIAYVNTSGKVTALQAGTVIIYGKIGDKTISCKIKIKSK